MKQEDFRSDCPITSALDVLGDKWILVIIKQMLLEGAVTFKDFIESDEAIASNILTNKLKMLEHVGLIEKKNHPTNKKTNLYFLTEMGLSLTPIIIELALFSDKNLREMNPIIRKDKELVLMENDREAFIETLKENYRKQRANN